MENQLLSNFGVHRLIAGSSQNVWSIWRSVRHCAAKEARARLPRTCTMRLERISPDPLGARQEFHYIQVDFRCGRQGTLFLYYCLTNWYFHFLQLYTAHLYEETCDKHWRDCFCRRHLYDLCLLTRYTEADFRWQSEGLQSKKINY